MVCCSALNWHDRETVLPMLNRNKLPSRVVLQTCRLLSPVVEAEWISDRSLVDTAPPATVKLSPNWSNGIGSRSPSLAASEAKAASQRIGRRFGTRLARRLKDNLC